MLTYRTFRNTDPPALADIWRSRSGQPGLAAAVTPDILEQFVFAKLYFDGQGLTIACEDGRGVGFAHAGFGASDAEDRLSREAGTTCLILVRPDCQQAQVAGGLLERSEAYLRRGGAKVVYGGGIRPLDAFYLGLYGGSELPGVLESDQLAQQVYAAHGYREIDRTLLFRRDLATFEALVDRRQMQVRRQMLVEVLLDPPPRSWWEASTMGMFDLTRFALVPRSGGAAVANATFRRMDLVPSTMQPQSVGLLDIWVEESLRRRGLAVFLLSEACRQFAREGTLTVEVQAMQHNLAAQGLYRKMGFQQIGQGSVLRKEEAGE
ncbi:MAG: GNAT family N-acetyltransferase [Thermoguttaceae bacterium]|jgi:ribosomal protein S18 acetylase RimI-like enzyme